MALNESKLRRIVNEEMRVILRENVENGKGNLDEHLRMYDRLVESLSPRFRVLAEGMSGRVKIESCESVGEERGDDEVVLTIKTTGTFDGQNFTSIDKTTISYSVDGNRISTFAGGETKNVELDIGGDEELASDLPYQEEFQEAQQKVIDQVVDDIENDSDIIDNYYDAEERERDPHKYYGVSRSDF